MLSTSRVLIATALLVATGVVHGLWTDRWKPSAGLERAVARLDRVPMTIGDWQATSLELPADEVQGAQLGGYLMRRYMNRFTGQQVLVVLMCGRPGPVGVHTPDVCWQGAGYDVIDDPTVFSPEGTDEPRPQFHAGRFRRTGTAVPSFVTVLWSWTAGGNWRAPTNPRWTYARYRALYKLYVVLDMPSADARVEEDPRLEFVRQLMPELDRALFPTAPASP